MSDEMYTKRMQLQDKWLCKKLENQDRIDLGYLTPVRNFGTPYFLENNWQFLRQFFKTDKKMTTPYTDWFNLPDGKRLPVVNFGEKENLNFPLIYPDFSSEPKYEDTCFRRYLFQILFEQMLKAIYNPEKDYNKDLKIVSDVNRYTESIDQYPLIQADDFQIEKWNKLIEEDMKRFNF